MAGSGEASAKGLHVGHGALVASLKRCQLRGLSLWRCNIGLGECKVPMRSPAEDSDLGTPTYLANISIRLFKVVSFPDNPMS